MKKNTNSKNYKNKKRAKWIASLSLLGLAVVAIPAIVTPVVVTQKNRPKNQVPSNNNQLEEELDKKPELPKDDSDSSSSDTNTPSDSDQSSSSQEEDKVDGSKDEGQEDQESKPSGDTDIGKDESGSSNIEQPSSPEQGGETEVDGPLTPIQPSTPVYKAKVKDQYSITSSTVRINTKDQNINDAISKYLSQKYIMVDLIKNFYELEAWSHHNFKVTFMDDFNKGLSDWGTVEYQQWIAQTNYKVYYSLNKKIEINSYESLKKYVQENLSNMLSTYSEYTFTLKEESKPYIDRDFVYLNLNTNDNKNVVFTIPVSSLTLKFNDASIKVQTNEINEIHKINLIVDQGIESENKSLQNKTLELDTSYNEKTYVDELLKKLGVYDANDASHVDEVKFSNLVNIHNVKFSNIRPIFWYDVKPGQRGYNPVQQLAFDIEPKDGFTWENGLKGKRDAKLYNFKVFLKAATWGDVSKYYKDSTTLYIYETKNKKYDNESLKQFYASDVNVASLLYKVTKYMKADLDLWNCNLEFIRATNHRNNPNDNYINLRLKLVPRDGYTWTDEKKQQLSEFTIGAYMNTDKAWGK